MFNIFLFANSVFAQFRTDSKSFRGTSYDCDFCIASQGISPLEMGRSGIRYDVRYLKLSRQYKDGILHDNPDQEIETHFTNQFTFLYHILPDLSGSVMIPYAIRHSSVLDSMGMPMTIDNSGIGDISAIFRYNILADHEVGDTRIISVNAGIKVPTGNTTKKDANDELVDAHLQIGTGSTDFILGSSFLLAIDRTTFAANLTGVISGKGANNHTFGNNLNYDANVRYRVYPPEIDNLSFFATLGFTGEWRGREIEDGEEVLNSGGNVSYIAPGIQIFFSPSFSFEGSFQKAIIHSLNGEQLGETFRLISGIQYMF